MKWSGLFAALLTDSSCRLAPGKVETELYTVVDGYMVDANTLQGFRTWRAAASTVVMVRIKRTGRSPAWKPEGVDAGRVQENGNGRAAGKRHAQPAPANRNGTSRSALRLLEGPCGRCHQEPGGTLGDSHVNTAEHAQCAPNLHLCGIGSESGCWCCLVWPRPWRGSRLCAYVRIRTICLSNLQGEDSRTASRSCRFEARVEAGILLLPSAVGIHRKYPEIQAARRTVSVRHRHGRACAIRSSVSDASVLSLDLCVGISYVRQTQ